MSDAQEALLQAHELGDFQGVGVRCREALLGFVDIVRQALPWKTLGSEPKRGDFKAWIDHVCVTALEGATHEYRRLLFKALLENAWKFDNWLTHSKSSSWHDAEAAVSTTNMALDICISTVNRHFRMVPEMCPSCASRRLSTQYAENPADSEEIWQRPACDKCGWTGVATPYNSLRARRQDRRKRKKGTKTNRKARPKTHECSIQTVPLRDIKKAP